MAEIKSKSIAIAIVVSVAILIPISIVSAQNPVANNNNQSVNSTRNTSLVGTAGNQSNASSNSISNAFNSLKDTFGSIFGK